jgi:integrase
MVKFTEGFHTKLVVPPGAKDVQIFDDEVPGFGCRKFASGACSFFVKYSVGAQQRRLTLGAVTKGNLKTMRNRASDVLARARLGQDVVGEKDAAKAAATKAVITVGLLVPKYLKARAEGDGDFEKLRDKSLTEVTRYLTTTMKPLHPLAVDAVTRGHIEAVLNGIDAKVAADRARAALSTFFSWCKTHSYIPDDRINPTTNCRTRSGKRSRTRTLSETELVLVWQCCLDDDFGRIVKLLLLSGQRRMEIGDLRWSEINPEYRYEENTENQEDVVVHIMPVIDLPEARTKNGLPHLVPLSDQALALLPKRGEDDTRDLVFGTHGSFGGWDRGKKDLDARIAKANNGTPLPHWTLHDLRRSFGTIVSERGISLPHVTEAIVNHISGHKANTAGIYNRALYLLARRKALEKWAAHVLGLVAASKPLRKAA